MSKKTIILLITAILLGLPLLIYYSGFLSVIKRNVERQAFEVSKPYIHAAAQDLAKYYAEYMRAKSADDKEAILSVVRIRFAEFDESKLKVPELKVFLKKARGY